MNNAKRKVAVPASLPARLSIAVATAPIASPPAPIGSHAAL